MSTFALIHGGGDVGWYWHLVEAELRRLGHDTVAPDLPCDDDTAGLSFGGFTVPLVASRLPTCEMVFLAAMLPKPGEAPSDFWKNTEYPGPSVEGDTTEMFLHDVPADLAEEALRRSRSQSDARMNEPWPLAEWPSVPSRFILCTEDRFFPPDYLRKVVRDRLGVEPEEIAAGHCVALSRPRELASILVR
jgi:pimeloyl-ACP methyl ester carboxylesterase